MGFPSWKAKQNEPALRQVVGLGFGATEGHSKLRGQLWRHVLVAQLPRVSRPHTMHQRSLYLSQRLLCCRGAMRARRQSGRRLERDEEWRGPCGGRGQPSCSTVVGWRLSHHIPASRRSYHAHTEVPPAIGERLVGRRRPGRDCRVRASLVLPIPDFKKYWTCRVHETRVLAQQQTRALALGCMLK